MSTIFFKNLPSFFAYFIKFYAKRQNRRVSPRITETCQPQTEKPARFQPGKGPFPAIRRLDNPSAVC
ncbi:hypothetical protein D7Y41_30215 [Anaerotruncus sp. 1XD22-93]|nr:hypothetical protein D7Y41_30215 [Anaerotruncus sp. 1XD22-93]